MEKLKKTHNSNAFEAVLLLFIFLAINLYFLITQKQMSRNQGIMGDAVHYYNLAIYFFNQFHTTPITHYYFNLDGPFYKPFLYRIGTPFLAAIFPTHNLLLNFKIVNFIGNFLSIFLFMIWIRFYVFDLKIRVLFYVFFLMQVHGPFRFLYYSAPLVESWTYVWLLSGLILSKIATQKTIPINIILLSLSIFVGILFREAVFVIPIAFTYTTIQLYKKNSLNRTYFFISFIPLLSGIASLFLSHHLFPVSPKNKYSFISTIFEFLDIKTFGSYILSLFFVFGPSIALVIFKYKDTFSFFKKNQNLFIYFIIMLFLAWIGGTDTERFLCWTLPIFYILLGTIIEENSTLLKSKIVIVSFVITQMVSQRFFWAIPDYATYTSIIKPPTFLTVFSSNFYLQDLFSFYQPTHIRSTYLLQYGLLLFVLLLLLYRQEIKMGNHSK